MRKFQCLLFALKRSYICYYIFCMSVPSIEEADYNWFMIEQNFWKSTKQNKHFSQEAGNIVTDPPEEL